jgi:hypothetical protein
MEQIETLLQCHFYHGAKIMEAIERFFSRTFGDFFSRLSSQMGYRMTDMAETKVRDAIERPFNRNVADNQQKSTDYSNRSTRE